MQYRSHPHILSVANSYPHKNLHRLVDAFAQPSRKCPDCRRQSGYMKSDRVKVAVNTLFLIPGEVGGSETYLCETLLAVARAHADVELALVTNQENDAFLRALLSGFPQCSFHRMSIRAYNRYVRILVEQCRLPFVLRRIRPDVLWSPGYTMPFWAPCKQVVSILDMQYRSHPDDLTRVARWTTHGLVSMAARRADHVLTISAFSKTEIARLTSCPPERITVTHLGVDPAFARATGESVAWPEPYILCVANSYPHKNLHRLAEAFARITDRIPHHLVLIGKPRLGEAALQRALARVSPGRVHRRTDLSRDELIRAFHRADLFVFPSLYEGFGLPVLESMMAGTPVVTTSEGALPEVGGGQVICADGRDPVDLAQKIIEVAGWSADKRRTWGCSAGKHAEQFTWQATAEATVSVWRDLSGAGKP